MISRMLLAACALLLGSSALVGVQFSGATWTSTSNTPVSVTAASDWAPPTVTLAAVPSGVYGTTTITATATDDRSSIASVVLQYAPIGTQAWTTLSTGCTASSGPSPLTYSCAWDTTSVPDSSYDLRATATDAAVPTAHSATSAVATTLVGNTSSVTFTHVASPLKGSVSLTSTFHRAVSPTAALYFEYLSGGTWTQINGCFAANANSLTCTWNTTTLADGTYDLRARAVSGATVTDVQSGIVVDNTLPTLDAFTVPAGVLSGTVALAATATDSGSGLASVNFSYQVKGASTWTACGTDTTAPFSCSLDTTGLTNGASYVFQAIATDRAGNVSSPATLTRTVSNAPASVSITSPTSGAFVAGTYSVTANASSDRGVTSVEIDARPSGGTWAAVCTATTAPYTCSWNTKALVGGGYQLQAVLTETYGGKIVTSPTTTVTVDNTVGTVAISSPIASSTVKGSVSVSGTAASTSGVTLVQIQARLGTSGTWTTVCTSAAASYSCIWDTSAIVFAGYQLQAVMTQGNGLVATSSAVTVNVNNVSGTVSITSPAAGNVRGTFNVTASATSNAGVTSVQLEMRSTNPAGNFAPLCPPVTVSPYTCSWNTSAIPYGTYEVDAVMTQGDGSTITSAAVAVTVDNRVLGAADVQATNGGTPNVLGTPNAGDTLTLTYSGLADLTTIQAGWTGASTSVTLTFTDQGNSGAALAFTGANLGAVAFSQSYVKQNKSVVIPGTMTATTSTVSGAPVTVVTITLGTIPPASTLDLMTVNGNKIAGTLTWTPSVAVKDLFGTASAPAAAIESDLVPDPDL